MLVNVGAEQKVQPNAPPFPPPIWFQQTKGYSDFCEKREKARESEKRKRVWTTMMVFEQPQSTGDYGNLCCSTHLKCTLLIQQDVQLLGTATAWFNWVFIVAEEWIGKDMSIVQVDATVPSPSFSISYARATSHSSLCLQCHKLRLAVNNVSIYMNVCCIQFWYSHQSDRVKKGRTS